MAAPMCAMSFAVRVSRSNLLRFQRLLPTSIHSKCKYSQVGSLVKSEEPQYPPIPLPKDCKEELIRAESDPVLAAETPAEMIYALNKCYTWNYKIHPFGLHNDFSSFYKHLTKSEVVEGFPEQIQALIDSETVANQSKQLSDFVQNIILSDAHSVYRHKQDGIFRVRDVNRQMWKNLMNGLVAHLSASCDHLMDANVDVDIEMKSFWQRGSHKFYQYVGEPLLTIRTKEPLGKFADQDSELCVGSVPDWPYGPQSISIFKQCQNAACFPGFKHGGGHLNAHTQLYVADYNRSKMEESNLLHEVHEGHGVSSSFAWLNALALYQKHCCYIDIPRPMTCQTIVVHEKRVSFYCYQLNTLTLDDLKGEDNDLRNVCWQVVDLPLYSGVEDNKVQDFNQDVLKMIVAFLTNPSIAQE